MFTSDFDYNLPKELIAQTPISPRDCSRLMVLDRKNKLIQHKQFKNITQYLSKGDLLVWNNTKVFKARLNGKVMLDELADDISDEREKRLHITDKILNMPSVEIFLIRPMENFGVWKVLAKPGRKLRLGMRIMFSADFGCEVLVKENDGTILVQFNEDDMSVRAKANKYGVVPTPPYIYPSPTLPLSRGGGIAGASLLEDNYQTVYAKHEGSVAAPTAGFHFTPELIEELKNKGVEFAEVTLHVGLGTFLPVKTVKVEDHTMHSEWVELTAANADKINLAKSEGRRVVAVGTTTVRTLEGVVAKCQISNFSRPKRDPVCPAFAVAMAGQFPNNLTMKQCNNETIKLDNKNFDNQKIILRPYTGDINIFIIPGFKFQIIDGLITNFHLPKSTLLMLVSAFIGDRKFILNCYKEAVDAKYRFYSFGDAMLIK